MFSCWMLPDKKQGVKKMIKLCYAVAPFFKNEMADMNIVQSSQDNSVLSFSNPRKYATIFHFRNHFLVLRKTDVF